MFNLSSKNNNEDVKKTVSFKNIKTNEELLNECLDYFSNGNELNLTERGLKSRESLLEDVSRYLEGLKVGKEQILEVTDMFEKHLWKYGILYDLIENDEDVTDIKVMNENIVRGKRKGKRYTTGIKFYSADHLDRFVKSIAIRNRINISKSNAQQTFTDATSFEDCVLRITISDKYINSCDNSYLHIRKLSRNKNSIDRLIEFGLLTLSEANYLKRGVKEGKNIVFVGKGSSGKTTILNTLIDEIPHDKAGLIIQENEELFSDTHPEIMRQRVIAGKGEDKVKYTLKELSINALLMDIDYFIIGEIKGGEAKYFQNAFYTGYSCMTTIHGVNSTEGMEKMVDYMKYETNYSRADLLRMLTHIDIVVFMKDFMVQEISETIKYDFEKNELIYNKVYEGGEKISNSIIWEGEN